jgi:hypothetical protein
MARKQHDPPIPAGLSKESAALFVKLTDEVDFPPEKLMQLEAMCRTLDVCAKLQAEVDALDSYRVRGSQGQPVSAPELADLARYRALIVSQARALDISDDAAEDDAGPRVYLTPSELGKRGAAARWGNRRGA